MRDRAAAYNKRFDSEKVHISSLSYECAHGKHYEVEVKMKECGHKHIYAHSHNYREHWRQMYQASRELVGVKA